MPVRFFFVIFLICVSVRFCLSFVLLGFFIIGIFIIRFVYHGIFIIIPIWGGGGVRFWVPYSYTQFLPHGSEGFTSSHRGRTKNK